jgi:hypothetical protein
MKRTESIAPLEIANSTETLVLPDENAHTHLATRSHPVVVDLGTTRKSHIRALKQGEGKLLADVSRVIDEVRKALPDELAGKHLVPVVILYKTKRKRRSALDSIN